MSRKSILPEALTALLLAAASPAPGPTPLPAQSHPESLSLVGRTIAFVSSARGGVLRVNLAARTATPFIAPGAGGSASIFGVLADTRNRMLWVCSNDFSAAGVVVPGGDHGHFVKGFDLRSRALRISLALPGEKALCNDLAVARNGALFVTDTAAPHILRWRPGGDRLDVWLEDQVLGGGLDGLAFGADGSLYLNNIRTGALFRVAVGADGKAGAVTALVLSRPLTQPDGMRAAGGNSFVLAEGGGRVDRVWIMGDTAVIEPLAQHLAGPTGVDVRDGTAWYVEGQLATLFDPAKRAAAAALPFTVTPIAWTG